jgi:hypothetical protein
MAINRDYDIFFKKNPLGDHRGIPYSGAPASIGESPMPL